MDEIRRIYLGLPIHLQSIVFWVGRNYRTNKLSHKPGGGDIIVEYHSGKVFGYDWIKYPSRYVTQIFNQYFSKANENFEHFKEHIQLGIIKNEVARLFARVYEEDEFETVNFEEVWNSTKDDKLPWVKLQEFEHKKYKERREKQEKSDSEKQKITTEELISKPIPQKTIYSDLEDPKFSDEKTDLSQIILPKKNITPLREKNKKRRRIAKINTTLKSELNKPNNNVKSLEHLLSKDVIDKLKKQK